jgi:hypothetical protein
MNILSNGGGKVTAKPLTLSVIETALARDDIVSTERCLEVEEERTTLIPFNPGWCEDFFSRSGDINKILHSVNGKYLIVQGIAVMHEANAFFSRCMPGWAFSSMTEFKLKEFVHVGDTVGLTVKRLPGTKHKANIEATMFLAGWEINKVTISLVSEAMVERTHPK